MTTEVRGNSGAPYTWEEKIEEPGSDGHKETRRDLDNEYDAFCDWRCVDPYIIDEIKQLRAWKEKR